MILKLYSVFDSKLACFGKPWYGISDAGAIREFGDAVNDGSNPNNQWFKHPEDFSLFYLGEFNDELGVIECVKPAPLALVTASALFTSKASPAVRNGIAEDLAVH